MAARKIQDKEQAILEAAVIVFAERGFWNTPTSLISKTAGVAEGTLFNYFATKDELINAVYLAAKTEMAKYLLDGLASYTSTHDKMRHLWNRSIDWGVQQPEKFKVLHQISESFALDEAVKEQVDAALAEVVAIVRESMEKGEIHPYPADYLSAMMDNIGTLTIQFITTNPDNQIDYKKIGFDNLWQGVTR